MHPFPLKNTKDRKSIQHGREKCVYKHVFLKYFRNAPLPIFRQPAPLRNSKSCYNRPVCWIQRALRIPTEFFPTLPTFQGGGRRLLDRAGDQHRVTHRSREKIHSIQFCKDNPTLFRSNVYCSTNASTQCTQSNTEEILQRSTVSVQIASERTKKNYVNRCAKRYPRHTYVDRPV